MLEFVLDVITFPKTRGCAGGERTRTDRPSGDNVLDARPLFKDIGIFSAIFELLLNGETGRILGAFTPSARTSDGDAGR